MINFSLWSGSEPLGFIGDFSASFLPRVGERLTTGKGNKYQEWEVKRILHILEEDRRMVTVMERK